MIYRLALTSSSAAVAAVFLSLSSYAPGAAAQTTTWSVCAPEGGTCSFSGSRQVRYGSSTAYVTRTLTGPVTCSNGVFGDPAPGVRKNCWVASTTSSTPTPAPSNPSTPATGGVPTPASIAGKPVVGAIRATSGQVIQNVHVTSTSGPCILIPPGVTNVTIRNSEIGPCGTSQNSIGNEGVQIASGAANITIQRNVIHNVSTAVHAGGARHPIVIDRNYVYNVRGPSWQGQMVQFNNVRGGSGQSKVTCNIKDGLYAPTPAVGRAFMTDHISMYNTAGTAGAPIEIAYNRIRGQRSGSHESGSGMQLGDSPAGGGNANSRSDSGWYNVHDNTIVNTNGAGISVAGGHDIRVASNRVYNRGVDYATLTSWSYAVRNFEVGTACYNISFVGNRSSVARIWAYARTGYEGKGLWNGGGCSYSDSGNNYADGSLTERIFDEAYSACS